MTLRCEGVCKRYLRKTGEANFFWAVQPTDFTLAPGKVTVLMGRSGSGKTTFLSLLAGLLTPTEGKVYLDETDLYSLPDEQLCALRGRQMAVIPQGQSALPALTVAENVLLPRLLCAPKEQKLDPSDALPALRPFGLERLAEAYPEELSGGELRRLAIARALSLRPSVLFADEPTADLDDENTHLVLDALRQAAREGAAVLLVTHENEAVNYADTLWRMDAGRLEQQHA